VQKARETEKHKDIRSIHRLVKKESCKERKNSAGEMESRAADEAIDGIEHIEFSSCIELMVASSFFIRSTSISTSLHRAEREVDQKCLAAMPVPATKGPAPAAAKSEVPSFPAMGKSRGSREPQASSRLMLTTLHLTRRIISVWSSRKSRAHHGRWFWLGKHDGQGIRREWSNRCALLRHPSCLQRLIP